MKAILLAATLAGLAGSALAAQDPAPGLREGMSYYDFRKAVLAAGWLPVETEDCVANTYGKPPALDRRNLCAELPELDSCSGDGHCILHFQDDRDTARFTVTTYGEANRWNAPLANRDMLVTGWGMD